MKILKSVRTVLFLIFGYAAVVYKAMPYSAQSLITFIWWPLSCLSKKTWLVFHSDWSLQTKDAALVVPFIRSRSNNSVVCSVTYSYNEVLRSNVQPLSSFRLLAFVGWFRLLVIGFLTSALICGKKKERPIRCSERYQRWRLNAFDTTFLMLSSE